MDKITKRSLFGKNGVLGIDPGKWATEAPLVEIDTVFKPSLSMIKVGSNVQLSDPHLISLFKGVYNLWSKFGPFGDKMVISEIEMGGHWLYLLDYIGRLSFLKPGIAADLVIFVRDTIGAEFFVGIKRKNDPGKDKAALVGGFRNVRGFELDTPVQTVIEEAEEEAGIILKITGEGRHHMLQGYINVAIAFKAKPGISKVGQLHPIGTFPTSESEEFRPLGMKRVYETTAYTLKINFDKKLSKEELASWFVAGDDASHIYVEEIGKLTPDSFGLKHHADIFFAAPAQKPLT